MQHFRVHTSTSHLFTPGFLDQLVHNTGEYSPLNDGFSIGMTLLQLLTSLPALGMREHCRQMLRNPQRPSCWSAPGLPDPAAGWPEKVSSVVAEAGSRAAKVAT